MKKKLILNNIIQICLSLVLFLFISVSVVNFFNRQQTENELKRYLTITASMYNGDNELEVANILKSYKNLRLSFIDLDGNVIYDSFDEDGVFDSHIDRPEILNLDTVFIRRSDTLDMKMMYIATKDNGAYIRLAIPFISIMKTGFSFLIFGLISMFVLILFSFLSLEITNRKALQPLNEVVNKLSFLAGGNKSYANADDIEVISSEIDDINLLINQKIEDITDEKDKVNFLINNMNQGIIVIDSDGIIILINDYVLNLYNYTKDEILNKDYLYLIRNQEMQKQIKTSIERKQEASFDIRIDSKIYLIKVSAMNNKWTIKEPNKNGVVVRIFDVTESRTIEIMKREFFANASHELKSPLTNIIGYQQMIVEGIVTSPEDINDATKRTIKEANRMHKIILDMLELSKLENKEAAPIEKVDISNVVTEIIDSYTKEINDKKIRVKLNLNNLIVEMNMNYAIQLVRNLIDNAIKYNIINGELEITTSNKELIVKDTGIGIAKEHQSRVFERFYRVDKGRSKDLGGTGLGLAIVKHICSLYNAKIILTSELGKGTLIKVVFKANL